MNEQLLDTWNINNRINLYMLAAIALETLEASVSNWLLPVSPTSTPRTATIRLRWRRR
jgi:hypothetical protein